MAKVIDQSYAYNEVCPAISAYLTANWDWGAIDTGVELTYLDVTGSFTVFYADIDKTIGIAVGENTLSSETYAVGIVLNGASEQNHRYGYTYTYHTDDDFVYTRWEKLLCSIGLRGWVNRRKVAR